MDNLRNFFADTTNTNAQLLATSTGSALVALVLIKDCVSPNEYDASAVLAASHSCELLILTRGETAERILFVRLHTPIGAASMSLWRTLLGLPLPPERAATASPEVPRVLYKYLPVERCHHWLVEQTVGFVALELLNDPYEGVILSLPHTGAGATRIWEDTPVVKYRIGLMTDYGENPGYDPEARRKSIEKQERLNHEIEARRVQANDEIKSYRILSLSRTPDNMVMWAHYASNSKGLCIGIDWAKANLLVTGASRSTKAPKPIALTMDYKDHPFESRFERHENHAIFALSRKHTDWAYEREVRLLRHASDFAQYVPGTNDGVGLLPIPPDAISEIVLGASPDPSIRNLVRDRFKHFTQARVRQLQINSSGYGSRLRELKDVSSLA